MSNNDRIVLAQILDQRKTIAPDWSESEYFELFCVREGLREYPLDDEEREAGLVGGSGNGHGSDGGIDGFYIFVNGRYIRNPAEAKGLKVLKQNVVVDVALLQATTEASFELKRITRLKDTALDIFDFSKTAKEFTEKYNDALMNGIETFRTAHSTLLGIGSFALNVRYIYASRGDAPQSSNLLRTKATALEKDTKARLPTVSKCTFDFLGAAELVKLAITPPPVRYILVCDTAPLLPKDGGFVALVKLKDYMTFITDKDTGDLLDHLFDANVRDYQGDVDVNKEIRESLEHPGSEEFWWLNNGITILASKVDPAHNLGIDNPQIVNGLQTSMEIFQYFKREGINAKSGDKKLLIRVIASEDPAVQDRVTKATNSQTGISPAAMWATDPIQREIETLFKGEAYKLYYDRRKNYWRNRGIPLSQIVGVSELAQAVAAVFLQEPDHARARPARYFKKKGKDKELYGEIFSKEYPVAFYPVCAMLKKRVMECLRSAVPERRHRTNLIHYVLMVAASKATGLKQPSVQAIAKIKKGQMKDELIQKALAIVQPIYKGLGENDKVAKGTELVKRVKAAL